MITNKIREARNTSYEYLLMSKKLRKIQPERSVLFQTLAAKNLQITFEEFDPKYYFQKEVKSFVWQIVRLRKEASKGYFKLRDYNNAAFELRHAAHCLEQYGQFIAIFNLHQETFNPEMDKQAYFSLSEAIKYRFYAIKLFRKNESWQINLAFELSYLSKTIEFMMQNFNKSYTEKMINKVIELRKEAALIFEKKRIYADAYYEYLYLTNLIKEKQGDYNSIYKDLALFSLKAIDMCFQANISQLKIPSLYYKAFIAYKALSERTEGEEKEYYIKEAAKYEKLAFESISSSEEKEEK